jgi:NAD(P)-dependent dehydrogenase (short-subunit alcohol dehydrogenase family)
VLYNNAGVMLSADDDPVSTPDDVIEKTLDINVKGVLYACRHAIPHMIESANKCGESSSIVNVASFVAHLGAATPQVAYTASKGAVLAMTREIAAIYARRGVRANALCPGPVMTPLLAKFLSDDAKRERRLVHIPMGRFGEPREIVNGALFLASNESSWMTGQSLVIDGGITSAYVTPEGPAFS